MSRKFTFDHLDSTEFEKFCYDLLKLMGFVNVRWRKGTGYSSSPSDQGRDIEAEHRRREIDGTHVTETWFIESKHYKQGVPPSKIQVALSWAEAERPDVLLLVASNFFSNPAKEHIEKYKANNKPAFRIKTWELLDLRDYSKGKHLLLSKYSLQDELEFLNIMHPAHLEYIKTTHFNSLDYFFKLMDALESKERDEVASWLYLPIIQPRSRKPRHSKETVGELFIDDVNYEVFKEKCYEVLNTGLISDPWFTGFIVSTLLQATFSHGDTTKVDEMVRRNTELFDYVDELEKDEPEKLPEDPNKMRSYIAKMIEELPDRIRKGYIVYNYFCDEVVSKLLLEPLPPLEKYKD